MADPTSFTTPPASPPSKATRVAPKPEDYTPSEADRRAIRMVEEAFVRGRQIRRPHEQQWFVNKALERGNHYVVSVEGRTGLSTPPAPSYRVRLTINLISPTLRARASKFLKSRPVAEVVPATGDPEDRQNARFTSRALAYQTRKQRLEAKYGEAVRTAQLTDHGYWWFSWNPDAATRIKVTDPLTKEASIEPISGGTGGGDVEVEADGPWSLLVGDGTIPFIGNQPWIVRVKVRTLAYLKGRFPGRGDYVAGEIGKDDALRYEQQIGTLNSQGTGGGGLSESRETPSGAQGSGQEADATNPDKAHALLKEYFERPCPDYPKGRYAVIANGVLLKSQEELPYGFDDMANPYPCVDFLDYPQVGQYWGTTICEQLAQPQREYNLLRSKLAEHLRVMAHPKLLVAKQHQLAPGAWTSQAGEIVEYFAVPNLPEPKAWYPPNIAADTWKSFELLRREMQDIAHIYPESEGQIGTASSGFQTNLLQEAVDAVHQPDVDYHHLILEEAYYKIRRLMKAGYTIERLLTVSGHDMEPEAFEFSGEQIDDFADIVMIASSSLPKLPTARAQQILEFWKAGIYGPADDPEALRKVRSELETGSVDDLYADARKDEQQARIENDALLDGTPPPPPQFYEHHDIHYRVHTDLLKTSRQWGPGQREELLAHVILHIKFQNPQSAVQLALQYGMPQLVADLIPQGMPGAPAAPGAPGAPLGGTPLPSPQSPPPQGAGAGPAAPPAAPAPPAVAAPPPPGGPGPQPF